MFPCAVKEDCVSSSHLRENQSFCFLGTYTTALSISFQEIIAQV